MTNIPAVGDEVIIPARPGVKGTVVTVDETEHNYTVQYPDLDGVLIGTIPMRGYLVTSPLGMRVWSADSEEHAREQHTDAFPDELPIEKVEIADPWWIYIDDQYANGGSNLIAVGPYATEEVVRSAMEESGQIQGVLDDGGTDCWFEDAPPAFVLANQFAENYTLEVILIDPTDPSFFS